MFNLLNVSTDYFAHAANKLNNVNGSCSALDLFSEGSAEV